jgi:hypothetical protein
LELPTIGTALVAPRSPIGWPTHAVVEFNGQTSSQRVESMKKPISPKTKRFPPAKQRLMDKLLDKNSEGTITPSEKAELKQLVAEAERLMIANGKRLAKFAQSRPAHMPPGAVPLTVWVAPQNSGT